MEDNSCKRVEGGVRFLMRNKKGHIVVELAFVFPILAMIAFTFVMYMHGVAIQIGMGVAAREGARSYATQHYDVQAEELAKEHLATYGVKGASAEIVRIGNDQGMKVTKDYQIFIPLLGPRTYHMARTIVFYPEPLPE